MLLINEAVTIAPDTVDAWKLKARIELMAGNVRASLDSHKTWVRLRSANDKSGRVTNKLLQSLHGQILNEYRLAGDEAAFSLSQPGRDQRIAARTFRALLGEMPMNTSLAMSLVNALRRIGAIAEPSRCPAPPLSQQDRIPRKIFQFWDAADRPPQVAALMEENRCANPGYSHRCFDLRTALEFMQDKQETAAIKAIRLAPHAAAKADIFRLVLLWHEGGIFLDADDRCIAPLSGLIDHRLRFMGYQEPLMSIGNNFLAVQPHEPIIRAALDDAVTSFNGPRGEVIWLASGPGAMTRAVASVGTDETGMLLPGVQIIPVHALRRTVAAHVLLTYKSTEKSWFRGFLKPQARPLSAAGR